MSFQDTLSLSNALREIMDELERLKANQGVNVRKKNTKYKVGDIVYSDRLPSWARLECIVAGETPNADLQEKGIFPNLKENTAAGEHGFLVVRRQKNGEVISEEKTDLHECLRVHMRFNSAGDLTVDDMRRLKDYTRFIDIFAAKLFDDAKITLPTIDLGTDIFDTKSVYLDEDGLVEILSVDPVEKFRYFSDIFGTDLAMCGPECQKQVLITVSINGENVDGCSASARTQLDRGKSFAEWTDIMDKQAIGRRLEVIVNAPAKAIKIKSITVQINAVDVDLESDMEQEGDT